MDKTYFTALLNKYLKGEASREELNLLLKYYDLYQQEPDILDLLGEDSKEELKGQMLNAISERIFAGEGAPAGKMRRIGAWRIAVSAAAILLVIFSARLFFGGRTTVRQTPVTRLANINSENHVIHLPDGSIVVLDSFSRLNYPPSFDGLDRREVFLDGQAFFDVRHNPSSPFIVHAGKLSVTVLGTSFNIKAFQVDADITVTVKNGMVKVSDPKKTLGTIVPRQQIVYNKEKENSVRRIVETDDYLRWEEQDMLFDNLTIAEAARLLEDRFHVKILIRNKSIRAVRFTATFPKDESLEQALKNICEFNGVRYRIDREKAIIYISNR